MNKLVEITQLADIQTYNITLASFLHVTQVNNLFVLLYPQGIGEGNGNPLQCSCLENPRDRGAWWAAIYGVAQSRTRLKRLSSSSSKGILGAFQVAQKVKNLSAMQETRVQSLGQEDPLEKEMATHSSLIIWRIPWTEEPGRLQGSCKELDMTKQLTLSQSREY